MDLHPCLLGHGNRRLPCDWGKAGHGDKVRARDWLSLAALLLLQGCTGGTPEVTTVEALLGRPDAAVTYATDEDGTLAIEVTSTSGIGDAELAISGPMPKRAVLRLRLRGLERLDVAYGQTAVSASLLGATGGDVLESVRLASGEEQPISSGSPYWMAITVVPTGTSPATIPLEEGYIEVAMPEDLLRSKERTITIRWIDFYR